MISDNSGKIYRFKLDHNLGYGFAVVYDFTDYSDFDGRIVYVYNKLDLADKKDYSISEITKSGIALGPIRLPKFPSTRGLYSWRFLFQTKDFIINTIPQTKELRGLKNKDDNWENLVDWYNSEYDKMPIFVPYKTVRHLETRILNPPSGVVTKFSMKVIIDSNKNISDYYDLSDIGNKNMFVQMINTYYPIDRTIELLRQLPT